MIAVFVLIASMSNDLVLATFQDGGDDKTESMQPQDDYHGLELTKKILRRGVFPVVAFLAGAFSYFIIFTVIDLGVDRSCKVLMGCVATTDFLQIFALIG